MASDRRPYVKIPDAVLREPWDDATLADLVRLQLWLNTRWARLRLTAEEAGRAFLGPQDMMTVTHTQNPTRARRRLLRLPQRSAGVTISVREQRAGVTPASPQRNPSVTPASPDATPSGSLGVYIEWPKFPKEQAYQDRRSPKLGANSGRSGASASASADAYKKGAHAPVKRCSTYRSTPDTSEPETERDRKFAATLIALKAEEDRDYSVAEIEERMQRAAG
jgi:hypothetical protein